MWMDIYSSFCEVFRDSLMVRMSACRVLDRGSIPRRGVFKFFFMFCCSLFLEAYSFLP